jgi:hypothetical protein
VPGSVFEDIKRAIVADRYAYFDDFFANFYNTDVLAPERVVAATPWWRRDIRIAAGHRRAESPYMGDPSGGFTSS